MSQSKGKIVRRNDGKNGRITSEWVVHDSPLKKLLNREEGYVYVPKWVLGITAIAVAFLATVLTAAILILYLAPIQATYGQSCVGRSCTSNSGLKCINTTCQCVANQFFAIKCISKKDYGEFCSSTTPCKDNTSMVCRDGVCKCLNTQYWKNGICNPKQTYKQSCTADSDCLTSLMLNCDTKTKLCICNNTRYWDGVECMKRRTLNETCTSTSDCLSSQLLSCSNGICSCTSTQYWDLTFFQCIPLSYENKTCTATYQCYSPMTCVSGVCSCSSFQYHDLATLTCNNQQTINASCSIDYNCRVDKGLECRSGLCQCVYATPFWSMFHNKCIRQKSYGEVTCYDVTDCQSGKSLVCNSNSGSNSCNCPITSLPSMCDCTRTSGNESYWNGSVCSPALVNGSICANNYMCQTLTQLTICNGTGSNFVCQCPVYQFLDPTQNKCANQQLNGGSCTINIGCRQDKNLYCNSNTCKCNTTIQFWSSSLATCVNYKTYTETCTNTNECSPSASLICNTASTGCNCPTNLGSGTCDCVRVSGNESYWNGSTCLPALVNGSICTNDYMCQTLTQLTICNGTGSNFVCQCPVYQFLDPTQNQCANQQLNGGSCTINIGCRQDKNLYCNPNTCKCNTTIQFWSSSLATCINYKNYTDTCTSTNECYPSAYLICNTASTGCNCPVSLGSGSCDCVRVSGNESYWNGSTCLPALANGSICSNDYMCQTLTQLTICNGTGSNFVCQCPVYQFLDPTQNKCANQQTHGGSCTINIGCRQDKNLYCNSNTCTCNTTIQFWSSSLATCVNYKTYTETCTNTNECSPSASLICNTASTGCNCPTNLGSGTCDCVRVSGNESYWNGNKCITAASYGSSCTANVNYTCQTVTELTLCDSTGKCSCGTNGGMKTSIGQCVQCETNWQYVSGLCLRISPAKDDSDDTGSSSKIDTGCGKSSLSSSVQSTVRLAKLDILAIKNWFIANSISTEQYWVDASAVSCFLGCSYESQDGTWSIYAPIFSTGKWCSSSSNKPCVYYDVTGDCYHDDDCAGASNQRYYYCQYTP